MKADLTDIVDRNIDLLLDEKGQFFRDCDLPKLLAKTSLAWDEIESLGYIFFEQGYIDKSRPTSAAHYGNGGVAEPDVYELARRYQIYRRSLSKICLKQTEEQFRKLKYPLRTATLKICGYR